jgi:hypothetical protein
VRLPRFPHRGVALVVAVPLVAAGLTSCAATTYDQTLAPDTAAVTTTTQPSGSAAELLPQLAAESASLSGVMIAGDDADAVREQIDALWAAARDEVRGSRPDLLDGFDQAVALVDKAVRFKRAADADKAARNLAILVDTFLG